MSLQILPKPRDLRRLGQGGAASHRHPQHVAREGVPVEVLLEPSREHQIDRERRGVCERCERRGVSGQSKA